ncbi:hypothetical protein ACHAWF_018899 [Thalassiosira exigua]
MANTACHDPISKCIRLPPASADRGAVLEGSIIEMDMPQFQLGKLLVGEVVEIVILDENNSPLAVYNEETVPADELDVAADDNSISRDELLQKQREQQQRHYQQYQELMRKHQQEKEHLDSLKREGILSDDSKAQMYSEMDRTHQRESLALQENHQSEQTDMMDLIFESASMASQGNSTKSSGSKRSQRQVETKSEPKQPATGRNSADLWRQASVAAVSARTLSENKSASQDELDQVLAPQNVPPKNVADRWNRAAVATVAAGAMTHSTDNVETRSEPKQPAPGRNFSDLWGQASVAAVSARTLGATVIAPDEEERFQAENPKIDSPHHSQVPVDGAAATPLMNSSRKKNDGEKQKQEELKAVMRNRTLSKEERIRRMSEIRQKYGNQANTVGMPKEASEEPPIELSASSDSVATDSSDAFRRIEIQSVMKDNTLSREEKQRLLAEIKKRYSSSQPRRGSAQSGQDSSSRWQQQAAVAAAASNSMQQRPTKDQPKVQFAQQSEQKGSGGVASRWKRGAAAALSASALNSSFVLMKQVEGLETPMRKFIHQLKTNDPSLTTLILDDRMGISGEDWSDLFEALESNTHLTHLSVADCDLTDTNVVPLILSLVENETLNSLNLSNNKELTSGTGKTLYKVLKQSNPIIKTVNIDGTALSSKIAGKIAAILDERDDVKKMEKLQRERENKIKELLAFSASDAINPGSARISERLREMEREDDENALRSVMSGSSGSSGGHKKKTQRHSKTRQPSTEGRKRRSTIDSLNSSARSGELRRLSRHGSHISSNQSVGSTRTEGTGAAKLKKAARSTVTARHMANLGGEVAVGKSMEQMKEDRKLRGECEDCGQKLFHKAMFKTTPLNIPGRVKDGRCLECNPP